MVLVWHPCMVLSRIMAGFRSRERKGRRLIVHYLSSGVWKIRGANDFTLTDEIMRGRETILVIDDEEMILDIGSKMLEGLGYKALSAIGGRQGSSFTKRPGPN